MRLWSLILRPAALALAAFSGGSAAIVGSLRQEGLSESAVRVIFAATLYLFLWGAALPWVYLAGYRLEKRYGLMRLSPWEWIARMLKAAGIGLVFFSGASAAVLWTMDRYGSSGWWVAASVLAFLSWSGAYLYPNVILPLFFRLRPLPEGQLRERLRRVCLDCGIRKPDLRQIDLSKISPRANAAVIGLAGSRSIVLSDTLLAAFTPEEVEFVLRHEIGHHLERHIGLGLIGHTLLLYAGCWAGFELMPLWAAACGQDAFSPEFLPVWLLCVSIVNLAGAPIELSVSRALEKRADAYALRGQPCPDFALSALTKLSEISRADPSPPAWEKAFFYTHPTLPERLRHVRAIRPA